MTEDAAQVFARDWIDAWNRRDAEAVLAHYADDAVFVSPKAERFAATTRLVGKAALREYWQAGLAKISDLHFQLDQAYFCASAETLTIVYVATLSAPPVRATEILCFRAGAIVRGEAFYGAAAEAT